MALCSSQNLILVKFSENKVLFAICKFSIVGSPLFQTRKFFLLHNNETQMKIMVLNNAPINVKPEGGDPGEMWAFDYLCYLHPREFD